MRADSSDNSAGTVLVMVLFVVAIFSIVAVGQMLLTRSELAAATAARQFRQARAAALSGIHRAIALLLAEPNNHQALYDNPAIFQAQLVAGGEDTGWFFTIYADNLEDSHNVRYGLEDEAAKINVNLAPAETLSSLPNMTPELVDCLMDYLDGDSDTRPEGAEQDYYDALPQPYRIKNGPLATLEELLLVKGFDGTIVFGEDGNRNGLLEPNEDDGEESFPPDDADGQLNRGLRHLATVITYEPNVDSDGQPRININTGDPDELARRLRGTPLGRQTVDFLVAARKANVKFPDPAHLLGATLKVQDPNDRNRKIKIGSGVDADNLDVVMDRLTTGGIAYGGQEVLVGRVNLNSAPREVLSALPGLDEDAAQRIVELRGGLDEQARSTTAWICAREVVSADVFKKISPFVTARSFQYRVRSFGYSPAAGTVCVLEAVIDLARGRPQISYLRDLTQLGAPFVPSGIER